MKLRHLIIASVVLAIVGVLVFALRPRATTVDAGVIHRGPPRVTVDAEGKVRVRQRHVVSSPLAGTLLRPELRAGDKVEANMVLARLRPVAPPLLDARARKEVEARARSAADSVRQAQAALERARTQLELANREATRSRTLSAAGSIAQDALERAEFERATRTRDVEVAERSLDVSRHELEVARAALLQTRGQFPQDSTQEWNITSPEKGVVLRVLQESEGVIQPGTPLLDLGDVTDLEVIAEVLTTDAVAIRPGAGVFVERWGGPESLRARIRRVEPSAFTKISALGVEEQRVNVLADFEDAPEKRQGLGDGYRVELRIVVADVSDRLLIPVSATFRRGAGWAAFVLQGRRAHLRGLQLGRRNDTDAEILAGATEGERVVLYPGETLREGARAEPR